MKSVFILIYLFIFHSAFCQQAMLQKLWVGDADNYMLVDKDIVRFERCFSYQGKMRALQTAYYYKIVGDTFRIIKPESFDSSDHDYLIKLLTADQLSLVPLNKNWGRGYISDISKAIFTFWDRNKIFTDSIKFEKIVFSYTTCYGNCPEMSFTIDSNKQMKFKGGKNAAKQGVYNAVMSLQLYAELLRILAVSDLDKLIDLNLFNIDAATYTLDLYYNGKQKSFKSFCFSYIAYDLFNYLLQLPKKVELKEDVNPPAPAATDPVRTNQVLTYLDN